jgi:hypothetical protein
MHQMQLVNERWSSRTVNSGRSAYTTQRWWCIINNSDGCVAVAVLPHASVA